MADLAPYISALAVASRVNDITHSGDDAAAAGGYAAFIGSIAGTVPTVLEGPDASAIVVTDPMQRRALTAWLDNQVKGALSKGKEPGKVQYDISATLTPWAIKYVAPVLIGAFLAGWLGNYFFGGRRK